jgi:predicted MFS family arabinose efflux permease
LVPALLPQFIATWSLSNAEAGWLAGMTSGSYMAAVLPLVTMTARVSARTIFLASAVVSALSCLGVACSDGVLIASIWRAINGVALAGMYMPGLRALTDGMTGARRARAAAWYTSSFTLGSSLSFLLGQTGIWWGWRDAFSVAGGLGAIGVLIAWKALPRPNIWSNAERIRPRPKFHQPFSGSKVIALIVGYAATIWGTVGLRQWIVVFLVFCLARQGGDTARDWTMLTVGALVGLLGVPAGLSGNELSLRLGLRVTAMGVFLLSALANVLIGFTAMLPYDVIIWFAMIAGFVVQGNFSNLTSGLLVVAEPSRVGITVAVYSCIGFAGGFLGTLLFGVALDQFGGSAEPAAWALAFGVCAVVCLTGGVAAVNLPRDLGRH